jgi:putative cell wall-binding protein
MRHGSAALLILIGLTAGLTAPGSAAVSGEPRFLTTWGSAGASDGQFDSPEGVGAAPDGTVYVADKDNHRIQAFDPDGGFITKWGSLGAGNGQLNFPSGVGVAPDGTVYVADTGNHRIQVFDPDGGFITKWGTVGSGDGQFAQPYSVAVAPHGTVYVADGLNHRIQAFEPGGDFITKWGSFGSGDGQFSVPREVAVAADGTVYVTDFFNHRVQAFDADGGFITKWGGLGTAEGAFDEPIGVAAVLFGVVYVADADNDRVQKFVFPEVTRAAGANRFATAAKISMLHHPIPQAVDTVFVATGVNFPDALAGAAAAAATHSPLLLTSSVPSVTAAELDRLDPDQIVILGGTSVVSSASAGELAAWGAITRLAGADRYETAVAISQHLYPTAGSTEVVVIATGTGFADALAAAPLAAAVGGPILLTPTDILPQVVVDEITRLDPIVIYIVGGPAAVSNNVQAQLNTFAPTGRLSGANRYATAVAISEAVFPDVAGVVYVAVGNNFPDALAGAAQAAAWGSPILLTPTDTLPQNVIDEIIRLNPYAIVILGGDAVISPNIETQLETLVGI